MAKKKANTQAESNPHQSIDKVHYPQPMDDAASEKLDSLKSLNTMLLKETVERRQQVDSLIQSNGSLESELNRSVMENASLQSELDSFTERAVMLEIENELVSVFAAVQVNRLAEVSGEERDLFCRDRVAMDARIEGLESDMRRALEEKGEKESEIRGLSSRLDELMSVIDEQRVASSCVCDERDEIRAQLDAEIGELNGLRLNITEAENREAGILKEVAELKVSYERLVKEKMDMEKQIALISREKDSIQRSLGESNGLVDELKRENQELIELKKSFEEEKNMQERKIDELQALIEELKGLVQRMRIKEETLLKKVTDLETKSAVSLKNEAEMQIKVNRLVEETKEKEEQFRSLVEEKGLVMKDLEETMKKLENQKHSFKQTVQEKAEMEDTKIRAESEIVKIKEQLGEFKSVISSLEKSSTDQVEKLKQFEAEVSHYRAAHDQATTEGDKARESLKEEKMVRADLQEKIKKMEKQMEDFCEELVKKTIETEKHLHEKHELEDRCLALEQDVDFIETKLVETRKEVDDTKAKLGLAEANSNMVLKILKTWDENSVFDHENGVEEGIKDHVTEIEAYKRVLKDKASRVEEMERQLVLLESSVAEANKGKSFWTLVSSATTVLAAAASVAYVARGH